MRYMTAIVHELRELKMMREELDAQIETLEDQLKEEMNKQGVDVLSGDDWKVTWNTVSTKRLNQKMLKQYYPGAVEQCTTVSSYRRFMVK